MNFFKNKIKEKSGSTYIEVVISVFVVSMLIALILKTIPVFILKNQLNTFATNVSRIISVQGIADDTVRSKIEEYRVASEIGDITISYEETDFISGTEKIQLNDQIVVTIETEYNLGFFTFGSFKVQLKNKALARSEVFWKD